MSLDDALREAAVRGLNGLTHWRVGELWQSNARFEGSPGWLVGHDADIVKATFAALRVPTGETDDVFG